MSLLCRSSFSSPMWVNMPMSEGNNNNSPDQENMLSTRRNGDAHQSGRMFQTNHADVLLPKQTRSPAFPSIRGASPLYTYSASVGQKRFRRIFLALLTTLFSQWIILESFCSSLLKRSQSYLLILLLLWSNFSSMYIQNKWN